MPETHRAAERPASGSLPWLVWGLGALFFLYGFFQRFAPSVMIDPLMRDLAVGGAAMGNISAFYFYAYAAMQIPTGLMVDRLGPRRLMTLGALVCAAGAGLFSQAGSGTQAAAGQFAIGLGAGLSFVCALTLSARWFPAQRFAQFTGLVMVAGTLGGFLAQAPLALAVEAFGWRVTLMGSALVGLVIAAAVWLAVRDWPPGTPPPPAHHDGLAGLGRGLLRVASRRHNLIVAVIGGAMSAPMLAFAGFWGVAWLMQTQGLSRSAAGGTTSLMLLGWAVGSPLIGWLGDRLGNYRTVLRGGCLATLLVLVPLIHLPDLPHWLFWICFFMAGAGASCMTVAFALVRRLNPQGETGAAFGLLNTAIMGSGAVFQLLIGVLLDLGWDGTLDHGARVYDAATYRLSLSALIAFLGLAFCLSLLLREPHPAKKAA